MCFATGSGQTGQQYTGGRVFQPGPGANYGAAWGQNNTAGPMTPGQGTYEQNMQAGIGAAPGAPGWVGNQLGWYNNTPQASDPRSYGRWNWLSAGGSGSTGGGAPPVTAPPVTPPPTGSPGGVTSAPGAPELGSPVNLPVTPAWQQQMANRSGGVNPNAAATNPAGIVDYRANGGYWNTPQAQRRQFEQYLGTMDPSRLANSAGTAFASNQDMQNYNLSRMDPLARLSLLGLNPDRSA